MALVPRVVDLAGATPVLAAGGLGDGRGLAAALMLGAQGVWIGTAFLATPEAGIPDYQKRALVAADADDTQISTGITGKPVRVIRGSWTTAWNESGRRALPMPWQTVLASPVMSAARVAERTDVNPGIAGQGVGLTRAIRPAAEIVADIVAEAEATLRRARDLA
jgi:nitronate monooxygenase